jgi:hypothetical protein
LWNNPWLWDYTALYLQDVAEAAADHEHTRVQDFASAPFAFSQSLQYWNTRGKRKSTAAHGLDRWTRLGRRMIEVREFTSAVTRRFESPGRRKVCI